MISSCVVRAAQGDDLEGLIALYDMVGFSAPAASGERGAIWAEMLSCDGLFVAVVTLDHAIVASATLVTAPNLLRGGRRHGFLENVATDPASQGRGYGRAAVRHVLEAAWTKGCHHILMQSGRSDPRVHRFYKALGFVPGIRTGYVAVRPSPD